MSVRVLSSGAASARSAAARCVGPRAASALRNGARGGGVMAACVALQQAPARAPTMRSTNFLGSRLALQSPARTGCRWFRHSAVVHMSLKTGIVGLPNVGKSTLFNALVENGKAQAANFPFCTIEPNVGIVPVPDERLSVLSKASGSQKIINATVEFVDIAGLVKGASKGEGLGNKFLTHIRECDSLVQVIRCFEDENVIHVAGKVDPQADMDVINLELALADLGQIEKRLERIQKLRAKDKDEIAAQDLEKAALAKVSVALNDGKAARGVALTDDEREAVKGLCLLTMKPITYAANVAEGDLADEGAKNKYVGALREAAQKEGASVVVVSAQVEAELNELDAEEKAAYLGELGVTQGGLQSLIRASYKQLGLMTYFTSGEKETRAWTIRAGMTAPQAAGVIHTDFEKGFIRAETVGYSDMVRTGTLAGAKEAGVLRSEGKEYVVNDGDIMNFRFSP